MEYQVCLAAVGLVGDLCRALNMHIAPLCEEIMPRLMANLKVKLESAFLCFFSSPEFSWFPWSLKLLESTGKVKGNVWEIFF